MENFGTTGLVPMIPYVAGAVGSFFGGPAGGMAAGSAAQEGVDYFSGNSKARTGQGILGSLTSGAGKGYLGGMGAGYGMDFFGGAGGEGVTSAIPSDGNVGDVFAGWSPTGSSASGMGSGLGTSSSNPLAYNDPYAAQDVMQQARDTSAASGSPTSWDTGSSSSGFDLQSYGKQIAKQLLNQKQGGMGGMGGNQQGYQYQPQTVQRQGAFAPTPAPFQVQDKSDIAALVAALRGKGAI
jgi:hypothetical protein